MSEESQTCNGDCLVCSTSHTCVAKLCDVRLRGESMKQNNSMSVRETLELRQSTKDPSLVR